MERIRRKRGLSTGTRYETQIKVNVTPVMREGLIEKSGGHNIAVVLRDLIVGFNKGDITIPALGGLSVYAHDEDSERLSTAIGFKVSLEEHLTFKELSGCLGGKSVVLRGMISSLINGDIVFTPSTARGTINA